MKQAGFKNKFDKFIKNENVDLSFSNQTEEKIKNIQEQKQQIMEEMKKLLQDIDNGEEVYMKYFDRTVKEEDGNLVMYGKKIVKQKISRGDLAVGSIWHKKFKLDKSINRRVKKEFVVNETKRKIRNLYNMQLIEAEMEKANSLRLMEAYQAVKEHDNTHLENLPTGILAEMMTESYLIKTFIDHPELNISLQSVDVYDDVRDKIDFIIHINKKFKRGLGVKDTVNSNIGIQFTINTRAEATDLKNKQIKKSKQREKGHIDDLVLVSIPIEKIDQSLTDWQKMGKNKPLEGPSALWDNKTKEKIFKGVLSKLPEYLNVNVDELWQATVKE